MCWVWALVRHFLFTLGLNDSLLYWPLFQPVHQISNNPGQGLSLLQARRTKTPPCQGKLMRTWFVVDQVREVLGVGGKVWPYCAHCHQPHATMLPAFLASLRRPGWRGCDVVSVSEVRQLQQENEASLGKLQETAEQFEWLCQQQRYWMCCVKRWVFSAWPQTGIYTHTQLMKVTSQKSHIPASRHERLSASQRYFTWEISEFVLKQRCSMEALGGKGKNPFMSSLI